ncbi:MAG TPA: hypothetical protein VFP60_11160 [Pseudolabrys sp.]|nr:hypothetical protein [Pseudolabrys sp.]
MRHVHLVGSVPLTDCREVFSTVSAALGPYLNRIPDGETGNRSDWITWLEPAFSDNPAFERSDELFRIHATGTARLRYRLRPGLNASEVRFKNLFYADVAKESFREFVSLKRSGIIAQRVKFQIDVVPAHSVIWLFLQDEFHHAVDPIYNNALKGEVDKIAAALPHDQIAIQFDVASAVFARLQRNEPNAYGANKEEMLDRFAGILVSLAQCVPVGIELLFHFCYGDSNHKHVVEPIDMGDMVALANRLSVQVERPIHLIHMPVPRDRDDDAYFAALANLRLKPETELCLGLVHYTDGVAGTRRRMVTAGRHVENFSVATECGFGRRDPATIPQLLRIHAEVAA